MSRVPLRGEQVGLLDQVIGNPCLEAKDDQTLADALAEYVIDRYIKTDAAWQEIQKNQEE